MQILPHQQNVDALRDLACAGLDLLTTNQFELLVERYGYARAFGRDPADAVRVDLAQALSNVSGSELLPVRSSDLSVVFYQENASCLRAAIDCEVPTQGGKSVWVSFVVTGTEAKQFFTLEDICAEPGPD
jgi:hypothetical protein